MSLEFNGALDRLLDQWGYDEEEPLTCLRCGGVIDNPDLREIESRICFYCNRPQPQQDEQP